MIFPSAGSFEAREFLGSVMLDIGIDIAGGCEGMSMHYITV